MRKPLFILLVLACLGGCGWFAAVKFANLNVKAAEGATVGKLAMLRGCLQEYYGKTEGKFPASLEELKPHLPGGEIPFGHTAAHGTSAAVQYMTGEEFRAGKFSDTGGWAYVNTPGDKDWGAIAVNCTHGRAMHPDVIWNKI